MGIVYNQIETHDPDQGYGGVVTYRMTVSFWWIINEQPTLKGDPRPAFGISDTW